MTDCPKVAFIKQIMALNILMVVIFHKNINLFDFLMFPGDTFRIPLFIFISGYLFKTTYIEDVIYYVSKKIKHLIIPYYGLNIVYGILNSFMRNNAIIVYGENLNLFSLLVSPFLDGQQFGINVSMWFVPQLFIIQTIYIITRKFLCVTSMQKNKKFHILLLLCMILIGCYCVFCINNNLSNRYIIFACRTMFLLPFFHLGWIYKYYFENNIKINNTVLFICLIGVQFFLIDKHRVMSIILNNYLHNPGVCYGLAITGIVFMWRCTYIIFSKIGSNRVIEYIGLNTWTVMSYHQLVFLGLNLVLFFLYPYLDIQDFDVIGFQNDIWYTYKKENFFMVAFYVVAGVGLPLLTKYWYEKFLNNFFVLKHIRDNM